MRYKPPYWGCFFSEKMEKTNRRVITVSHIKCVTDKENIVVLVRGELETKLEPEPKGGIGISLVQKTVGLENVLGRGLILWPVLQM